MKIELCNFLGHRPGDEITGCRNSDGAIIMYCIRCNLPIVHSSFKFSDYLRNILNKSGDKN